MPLIVPVKSEEALVDRPRLPKDDLLIVECRGQQEVHSPTSILVLQSNSGQSRIRAGDLLNRNFIAPYPNRVWVFGWIGTTTGCFIPL